MFRHQLAAIAMLALGCTAVCAQQLPDRGYRPHIPNPAYGKDDGPVVCLDEAHHNFHTLAERFRAFGELLRRDGYVVRPSRRTFDAATLGRCAILVISNAQPSDAEWDTYPTPTPPAFTAAEVHAVRSWVGDGGKLLLIADHMPLAGAAASLAAAFGVSFTDGFAVAGFEKPEDLDAAFDRKTIFRTANGGLRPHAIVGGRDAGEAVTSVRTFTGQAFPLPAHAEPLLVLPANFIALLPETAWDFKPDTRRIAVGGWSQGAVMRVGTGRAAFFGEAAMFSAQINGPDKSTMGMNAPGAEQNHQFVLNLMHWLSGLLD